MTAPEFVRPMGVLGPPEPRFDGGTYDPALDSDRLSSLLRRVYWVLADATPRWLSIPEIQAMAGGSETGVAAKLRDLRKARWGRHCIASRRRAGAAGCWEYRLVVSSQEAAA